MALISIREQPNNAQVDTNGAGNSNAQAIVSFDHGPEYPVTISDPFSQEEEQELEWYFEKHLAFPFTDQIRAKNTSESVRIYGERLFQQIFGSPKIYHDYKKRIEIGLNTLQIEIMGSPSFHRWHWEALKDPDLPRPLVLQASMVRKNLTPQVIEANVRPSPTINLLVVVARPSGKYDVGYRTISRPLVEALRQSQVPVQIDILRPGTYKALYHHLNDTSNRFGTGYYHVIHFDVHGAVLSYDQLHHIEQANRYLYQHPYGRNPISPYEGKRAFLALEDEQENTSDLVEAQALADLLIEHQIPIAILNACQSGKETGSASESSLGSRLMQAGLQLVLAMGYSVTVSAAALMMPTLYSKLFDKHDLSTTITYARQELYNQKERRAYFDQKIHLEDWLLPIVYQNQPVRLTTRPFSQEEAEAYYSQEDNRYSPPQPTYGFVGRDLDILQIEKRLLTRRNILLIRGMGGAGKTTLLRHLGSWWQTTGFVKQVCYFGYDERAWTREQIITAIAQKLYSEKEYVNEFQPLSLAARQARLVKRLRAEHHLLILDNLESITGSPMAIQHTLPSDEQSALHRLLSELAGGRTLVLLGSRGGEHWLAKETFGDNIYDLGGLDPEAATNLTDRILEKYHVTKYRDDKDLRHLVKLLGGFPLALEVVLANLKQQTPTEILTALQAGAVTLNVGDSQQKTENILRCIDYSHSNLSPEAQSLLVCLAPFTSVLYPKMLDRYTALLKQHPILSPLPFDRWQEVIQEAVNWGLLSPDPDIPTYLRIHPTLPYFLRTRLNTPEQAETRVAIETAFREHYDTESDIFYEFLTSKDPEERQLGQLLVRLEYENILYALNLALAAQASIYNPYLALTEYLSVIQDTQHGLGLAQSVLHRLETYPQEQLTGSRGRDFIKVIDDVALWQLKLKQYAAAETFYQRELTALAARKDIDADQIKRLSASIYHQLGSVAEQQRHWQQAEHYYQQALQIYIGFNDRYNQADTYHQLGNAAYKQRH